MVSRTLGMLLLASALLEPALARSSRNAAKAGATPAGVMAEFGEAIEVDVVDFEVFVTDQHGVPVTGLGKKDFKLRIDGRQAEIEFFEAVEDGEPLALVVYIDDLHLTRFDRDSFLERLRPFLLERLRGGDRVQIVSWDGRHHVHQSLTKDWPAVQAALDAAMARPIPRLRQEQGRQRLLDALFEIESGNYLELCSFHGMVQLESHYAHVFRRVETAVAHLGAFLESLSGLDERKAIFHVSSGIPLMPGREVIDQVGDRCRQLVLDQGGRRDPAWNIFQPAPADFDATPIFEDLAARAVGVGARLYAFDARGLRGLDGAIESDELEKTSTLMEMEGKSHLQGSLLMMAVLTGASAVLDLAGLEKRLARIGDSLDVYYTLGFTPPARKARRNAPRDLRLEVRVPGRRDLRLRHPASLRLGSRPDELGEHALGVLLMGGGENPLGVAGALGEIRPFDGRHVEIPLRLRIPLASLTLLPQGEEMLGQISVAMVSLDEVEALSPVRSYEIPVRLPAADAERIERQLGVYDLRLVLRPSDHRLGICVRDDFGAVESCWSEHIPAPTEI